MSLHPQQTEIFQKARRVKLLVLDVDGVLTDGRLYFSNNGDELKAFSTLDGQGIKMLVDSGVSVAWITGRESEIISRRAQNLGINHLFQNREDKLAALDELLDKLELTYAESAYVGDDLPDLACIRRVALGVTVPNAHSLVKEHALFTTSLRGGQGAVREVCDWILQSQDHYDAAIAPYL